MKRRSKQKELTINQPTKLFLEDIEKIHSIINETMDRVSIENDDYEFENPQDLLEIKTSSLTNLRLVGFKNGWPQIFFYVYPRLIYIKIKEDEPSLVGTFEKVKEIIGACKRPLLQPISFLMILVSIGLVGSISGLVIPFLVKYLDAKASLLVSSISLVFNITILLLIYLSRNKIILTYSKNTTSFWKRNSDKIIVAIITSIMTLIIGYIFGKITGFIP